MNCRVCNQKISNNKKYCSLQCAAQCPEKKIRARDTCLQKYGVEHFTKTEQYSKARTKQTVTTKSLRLKSFVGPFGTIFMCSGFTNRILEYFLLANVEEDDLTTTEVPGVYYQFDGGKKKYTADIFIKSKNMLVEVKSVYTWARDIPKNLSKHDAAKEAGFAHLIVIWDERKNCIREMIN